MIGISPTDDSLGESRPESDVYVLSQRGANKSPLLCTTATSADWIQIPRKSSLDSRKNHPNLFYNPRYTVF